MTQISQSIVYFEREGRENLAQVIRILKRTLRKRPDLRSYKIVIFTAIGEGPALAYNVLNEYEPTIIAVTFPTDFTVRVGDKVISPRISDKILALFNGLNIKVITSRLPFDGMERIPALNEQMSLIKDVLAVFGGSFTQAAQSVLQACDHGAIAVGEKVISVTGDSASIITATTTKLFLDKVGGLQVNEILCKARTLTIARGKPAEAVQQAAPLFDSKILKAATRIKELPKPDGVIIDAEAKKGK
jgi:hypothetical protein